MVRHKVRWMIVRLDFEEDIRSSPNKTSASSKEVDGGDSHSEALFPTKPEIYATLKSHLIQCFGVVAEAAAMDLQGEHIFLCLICTYSIDSELTTLSPLIHQFYSPLTLDQFELWIHRLDCCLSEYPENGAIV